jgi:hypothetical protein
MGLAIICLGSFEWRNFFIFPIFPPEQTITKKGTCSAHIFFNGILWTEKNVTEHFCNYNYALSMKYIKLFLTFFTA